MIPINRKDGEWWTLGLFVWMSECVWNAKSFSIFVGMRVIRIYGVTDEVENESVYYYNCNVPKASLSSNSTTTYGLWQ